MERPFPCVDLHQYCKRNNRPLTEAAARRVTRQVVLAAYRCCSRGVLHRDIKPRNILIDFGDLLTERPYTQYGGTPAYRPPEWVLYGAYLGVPAAVWGLGVFLFQVLCGQLPFNSNSEIVEGKLRLLPDLSEREGTHRHLFSEFGSLCECSLNLNLAAASTQCCALIEWCLKHHPGSRPTFEDILKHEWFTDTLQDAV